MKIAEAIISINPDAKFTFDNDDINNIQWLENTTPISVADIEAKIPEAEQAIADEAQAKIDNKASAKAKLIAGEPLTEAEADTLIL